MIATSIRLLRFDLPAARSLAAHGRLLRRIIFALEPV